MIANIRFDWDSRKADANRRKHGIRFETACSVFADPYVEHFVEGTDHGEIRYRALGEVERKLLVVSYTAREEGGEEIVRVISARKATRRERRLYEGNS